MIVDTLQCGWETARFLMFSNLNAFGPLVYYSHLIALITALGLGLFIFIKNRHLLSAKLFLAITACFGIWVLSDLVLWGNEKPSLIMFFWTITILLEPVIYILGLYFLMVYIRGGDITRGTKLAMLALLLPTILAAPTRLGIIGFNYTNCDREVFEGLAVYYGYLVEVFITLWAVVYTMRAYKKAPTDKKGGLVWVALGIILFFFLFAWGNIVGTISEDWTLGQYGLFGMSVLFACMTYTMVRFKTFDVKLIGSQALVAILVLVMGSILFIRDIENVRVVLMPSLLLVIGLGYFLIKGVQREVEQREYLEKISKELSAANDQLRIFDKQKNEFLSFASHDLKSPIALIKQFATLIYDGTYKDPVKIHETVSKIKNTADRAVNMVNTFLDLRKIEEGHMEYNFESRNVVEFVGSITNDFALLAKQQKNIDVSFASAKPDIQATIDSNTFRQVVQNYLDNSLKYTEAGWIKVQIVDEQKTVLIKFSDSGLGMDKELLPILFGQFHRDPGVAKKIQGTGLGLYIAKQIVLAHHGDTWAESEGKGKGSQFYIRLPKA